MDLFHVLRAGARFDRKKFQEDFTVFNKNVDNVKSATSSAKPVESLDGTTDEVAPELDFFNTASESREAEPLANSKEEIAEIEDSQEKPQPLSTKEQVEAFKKQHRIRVEGNDVPNPIQSFQEIDLAKFLKKSLSTLPKVKSPTAIQMQAIPVLMKNRDLLSVAPTGSGKTMAFLIPILHSLKKPTKEGFRAVVVTPTRELAGQIHRELEALTSTKPFKVCLLTKRSVGNVNAMSQLKTFDVLITTPARLCQALSHESLSLGNVRHLVLDEADKLLEETSFLEQIDQIVSACSNDNLQKCMFSATMPSSIENLATSIMRDPVRIIVGNKEGATTTIDQKLLFVADESGKLLAIRQLITTGIKPPVLIFVQSIDRAKQLFHELIYENINVDVIHSERTKQQRDNIIKNFRMGRIWVLICTELMSRGIDFKGVNLVINYDFPQSVQSYVHRIGRTGRAGLKGTAITYFTLPDAPYLKMIANVMAQSGCEVPDWMLQLDNPSKTMKKDLKTKPRKRENVDTRSKWEVNKGKRKREMIEGSKRRKAAKERRDTAQTLGDGGARSDDDGAVSR